RFGVHGSLRRPVPCLRPCDITTRRTAKLRTRTWNSAPQVGHQSVPRLRLRVLPRQEPERQGGVRSGKQPYLRHQFGFTFGGPIKRDARSKDPAYVCHSDELRSESQLHNSQLPNWVPAFWGVGSCGNWELFLISPRPAGFVPYSSHPVP